jgi:hypothetical protein
MGRTHKAVYLRQILLYDWERFFADVIHCVGKDVFLAQCVHLCHHGICNEGHVFVLPGRVKGTANVYESFAQTHNMSLYVGRETVIGTSGNTQDRAVSHYPRTRTPCGNDRM